MNKARVNGEFLVPRELTFQHKGRTYTLTVAPAWLKDSDGEFRDYFPGATEELVEEALRKLAIEKQVGYFDKPNYRSGVIFSLYELRQELKDRGHERRFQDIVHALNVLALSVLTIKPHVEGEHQSAFTMPVQAGQYRKDGDSRSRVDFLIPLFSTTDPRFWPLILLTVRSNLRLILGNIHFSATTQPPIPSG